MPLVVIFTFISDMVLKTFGGKPLKEQPLFNFEEIDSLNLINKKIYRISSLN